MRVPFLHRGAFTLIEMLVVMAVISALAALVISGGGYALRNARMNRAKTEIRVLELALDRFRENTGYYPICNNMNNSSFLLYTNIAKYFPTNGMRQKISGTITNLADPFGGPYLYLCPGLMNKTTFDLWSEGPTTNTGDDVTNWND